MPLLTAPYTDHSAVARWLEQHQPDAVVTGNYHFLDVMRSLGRKVPEDLGVACPLLPSPNTELAGVIENSVEIGSVAVDHLIGMSHRQERGVPTPTHPPNASMWKAVGFPVTPCASRIVDPQSGSVCRLCDKRGG